MSPSKNEYTVAGIDMSDLFPEPFPDDAQTVHLETISLAKLLANDEAEVQRVYLNCKEPGFFQLDLTDDSEGVELLRDAVDCARVIREVLPTKTVPEKKLYKQRDRKGVYSMGYQTFDLLPDGTPKYNETVNFPMTEMLGFGDASILQLPDWLSPHTELYQRAMRRGNKIANIVLAALELGLQVPAGSITNAHRIEDPSDDFLRLLRYPGQDPNGPRDDLRFPAHKDFTSLGILFTWVGGLQLPSSATVTKDTTAPGQIATGPLDIPEEAWRWVKPVPGTAIVNVGLALEVLTNKALTAGLHRVVRPPGKQMAHDRYSVLVGTRMAHTYPMRPPPSPLISTVVAPEYKEFVEMTSQEWGNARVKDFDKWVAERTKRQEALFVS
ncbi:Gibberellin 20 oxidase 1-A [Escovopsis weberi]|uniref:Gibberellin 20 oxidase 1-A n=1 Tax=Escovopsis weberi TaxID=150374 RepID=A0A0M9VW62_ESCWE|nr:Gibberellin 20 oxidase 1-A [Escovopsis weberi]